MFRWLALLSIFLLSGSPALWAGGADAAAPSRPIVVLGDSLSAAYRIAPEAGWVNLLEQRLQRADAVHKRPLINASISGETTSGGLARVPRILKEARPALLVLELGANDGLRGLPIEHIRANLEQILEHCRAAGVKVLLIGIVLPVNYGPQYRDALGAMYRDLARKYNLPLVPFLLEGIALDPKLMQDDGLHPTAEGEPRVLENVWSVLKALL